MFSLAKIVSVALLAVQINGDLAPNPDLDTLDISLTQGVATHPVHSHNTYDNGGMVKALENGCISMEADVWFQSNELYIAHTTGEIDTTKTLDTMYLDGLFKLLQQSQDKGTNGLFIEDPSQTLHLLIDFKSAASDTYPLIKQKFQRFIDNNWLTYYDNNQQKWIFRPLTVVLTGNQPDLTGEDTRYFTLDGDLTKLKNPDQQQIDEMKKYSVVASADMTKYLGTGLFQIREFSSSEQNLLSTGFTTATTNGLKSRLYGGVTWLGALQSRENQQLYELGETLINIDDVTQASLY
ncbi:putative altered inheritance of mitochondria protein 6 homolog ARB_06966 [[Candida] jaroonii]|uniref:Altered inheritance of mitochondria protein 6 homolog ARB_06966 n=1 Tax=[Candida] jaroonii TaxID=467808 RepID=A0ACA9YG44_9ASCO|nr:putative altered inheritance of mitochondria protein 6 homolog ARB_06966 [[Candida] jaroonii]